MVRSIGDGNNTISADIQKKEKENEAVNQNMEEVKRKKENDFTDVSKEEDVLNLNAKGKEDEILNK